MSAREAAQKAYAEKNKQANPSAFDAIGAFNKYYNPENKPTSLSLPMDIGKAIPPKTRAEAISSYNAQNVKAPKPPAQPGFWGRVFDGMEKAYNFTSQAVAFGATLDEKTNPIWQGEFNGDGVKKAWDASRGISVGQSVLRDVGQEVDPLSNVLSGITKTVTGGKLSGTDKFLQDHMLFAANNFDIFNKTQRQEAFGEQNVGRIGSWTTDVVARFTLDPTVFAGKAVKVYKGISLVVENVDTLKAIMAGEKTGFKANKIKNTFTSFLERTDNMNESDLFRVKAIRESSNPATFSSLIAEANNITDKVARHQAKADIIYMAQGDIASAQRLMQTSELLAAKVGVLRGEVAGAKYLGEGIDKATGNLTLDLLNNGVDVEAAGILITQHEDELARIHKALSAEAIISPNLVPTVGMSSGLRQVFSQSQKFIDLRAPGGMVPVGARVLTGFFYKRPKGWIDFNDNQSVQTLDNMLSRVRGVSDKQDGVYRAQIDSLNARLKTEKLSAEDIKTIKADIKKIEADSNLSRFTVERKDELFAQYTSAPDVNARASIYQEIEKEVFSTIARQYGFSDDAVQRTWSVFDKGRISATNLIKERAYTASREAADMAGLKPIIGAEGASYIVPLPLMETQLVHQLPTLNIDQMYSSLNKFTRAARFDKNGKVYRTTIHGLEAGNELVGALDSLIKFEVLARVGYPVRNVTEGVMRTLATVSPMAVMKAASVSSGNLISNRFVGSTFHDVFKWSNTVKMQTKRAELVGARISAKNVDVIDRQIAEIDKMLLNPQSAKDKFGMGLNQVDGVLYQDALGATPEAAKAITDKFIRNAAKIVDDAFTESHKSFSRAYETTGDFVTITGSDVNWVDGYIRVVNRHLRNSKITSGLLAGKSVDEVERFLLTTDDGRKVLKDLALGRDARDIVEANAINIDSLFPAGTEGLKQLASKRSINADDVEKFFGTGTALRPDISAAQVGMANGTSAISAGLANILDKFYTFAGEIPESSLVRHPLFVNLYRKRVEASVRNAIDTYPGKEIPAAYLRKVENSARQWARAEMRRTLYDTSERVDSAHTLKYIFPFFGAFADVAQKWGRILVDDPSVIRKLETIYDSPDRMGLTEERDGISYINIPGEWADRMKLGERPFAIPKPSLNLIFQGGVWWNPGAGWFVQYGASALLKAIPETEKLGIMKEILPYGPDGTGWKDLVIQNTTARKLMARFDESDPMRLRLTVTIAMEENHRYDKGERDTAPTSKEINDRALSILGLEAASRFILPFATNVRSPYQFYIDEYQRMRQEDSFGATEKFWNTYGEDYFIFTTSRSKNNTGVGATLSADKEARKLGDLIAKNPDYGWFIVGDANNGEFSPTVYRKQFEQRVAPGSTVKFRQSQDPYAAIKETQVSKGWIMYGKGMDFLEAQRISRGLKSLNSKGGEDLAELKRLFTEDLSSTNPAWGAERGKIDISKVNNFLKFASDMTKDERVANRPDIKVMKDYLEGREYIRTILAKRSSQVITNAENADIKELWDSFIGELIDKNITFNRVYTRTLENDDLRKGF